MSATAREFLPPTATRAPVTTPPGVTPAVGFDYPATQVGVNGNITVFYDSSLGQPGLTLAQQMVGAVGDPYADMEVYFGIQGGPVTVVIVPLSGANDGSGGAYHHGCDFNSGGTLYLDATFSNASINPLDLEVALYLAELSEAFMGAQGKGWGCGSSNGEGLSRFCAEQDAPAGSFPSWGITAPSWVQAGYPDFVTVTESSDRDYTSTGCAIAYLYWMKSLGFTNPQLTQAGGATLSANYQTLTGKTTAYADLVAAVKNLTVTTDNPFWPSPAGGWHVNDLTAATGAPGPVGGLAGYVFRAQATEHVIFRGADDHIRELWWNGQWNLNDLTVAAGAPLAAGDPGGYMFPAQETEHVVYRDGNGHICELWWNGQWNLNDLTAAAGAPGAQGDPVGYVFGAQGTEHVIYLGSDAHIHELWFDGTWHANDLTAATGAPLAAGDPDGYMFDNQGTQHVVYRGVEAHIHELWWDAGGWHHNDLSAVTGAVPAAGDPSGYLFEAQRTQHVVYRGTDGHIHELWWADGWQLNDLTAAAGAPAGAGDPNGYVFAAQGTQHVVHRDVTGHVQELWWNGAWHANDLTAATASVAPTGDPVGYMFDTQGTQHVVYTGNDGHIHELWWG